MGCSWEAKPIKEKTRVLAVGSTERVKVPSAAVRVPFLRLPFGWTDTPWRGEPSLASVILPVIVLFWAEREVPMHSSKTRMCILASNRFFMFILVYYELTKPWQFSTS